MTGRKDGWGVEFIVAPTEPRHLISMAHIVSTFPETKGCDVVWQAQGEWWGVQRKELKDFIASVQGDRIAREVAQMQGMPLPLILIEGRISYDLNGNLGLNGYGQNITKQQFRGMLWSIRHLGVHIDFTVSQADTVEYIRLFAMWTLKPRHDSLMRRPGPVSHWGKPTDRDFACHVLQGFDGMGLDRARAVYDTFGRLPLRWDVTEKELLSVKGLGKKIVSNLFAALDAEDGGWSDVK